MAPKQTPVPSLSETIRQLGGDRAFQMEPNQGLSESRQRGFEDEGLSCKLDRSRSRTSTILASPPENPKSVM